MKPRWQHPKATSPPTPRVPSTAPWSFVWGDRDATVGPSAARFTADFVTGPFRFEVLAGIGHFVTDEAPETVTRLLLSHLEAQR